MKICYTLATTDLDGGSRSLLNLLDHCVENSIEPIVVLTRKHNELQRILKDKNINYKIIRHGIDNFDTNIIKTLIKIILNEIAKFRIYYLIKKEKIDILHNNSLVSLIGMKAARMAHIPYICHIRELLKEGLNVKMLSYKDVQKCIKYRIFKDMSDM